MCGIAGWCLSTTDLNTINTKKLARALALGIEHRGEHATGIAFRTPSGSSPIQIHKRAVPATEFVRRMGMPRRAQVGLIHTRFATQGTPANMENNHPIANGGIVGVHNGHVSNDDELFRLVIEQGGERHGEVDSEAIFAAIAWNAAKYGGPNPKLADVLEGIRGGAAIAWLDESDPDDVLHLARLNGSPLVLGWTIGGSLIFASEADVVKAAAAAVNQDVAAVVHVTEGTCYTVVAGNIATKLDFTPAWRSYSNYGGATVYTARRSEDSHVRSILDKWDREHGEGNAPSGALALAEAVSNDLMTQPSLLVDDIVSPLSLAKATGTTHWDHYRTREDSIATYARGFGTPTQEQKDRIINNLGGKLRIGSWVRTKVMGTEYSAQVYEMPQTFPFGFYLLRALIWSGNRKNHEEWVLVARTIQELEILNEDLRTAGDIEATERLNARLVASAGVEGTEPADCLDALNARIDSDETTVEEMREWYAMQEAIDNADVVTRMSEPVDVTGSRFLMDR